jgi:NitT/TauT family transport system substrate-binding protein
MQGFKTRRLPLAYSWLAFVILIGSACSSGTSTVAQPTVPPAQPAGGQPTLATSPAALPSPAAAATLPAPNGPPMQATAIWTAVSGASGPLWTGYEEGYFKQVGLDLTLTNIASTSRAVDALLAGQAQFTNTDPATMLEADIAGADLRLIVGMENRLVFSVMTQPSITSPQDLKGKRLGITIPGSSTYTAARQALKIWGLQPDTDVALVPLQQVPAILAGLQSNQIDAGVVSPPTSFQAQDAGFKVLIDLAKDGPNYPSVGVSARESLVQSNPELVRRFVRGYAMALHTFMTDEPTAEKDMNKYLQLTDQNQLDETWQAFSQYLADPPEIPDDGIQAVIDDTASTDPKVVGTKPSDYLDMTFVKELEPTGIFSK